MPTPTAGRSTRPTAVLAVVTLTSILAIAFGVNGAQAADARLDLADGEIVSATALLAAATTEGQVSDKQQRAFDRAIAKGIAHIEAARAEIVEARDAVDNP